MEAQRAGGIADLPSYQPQALSIGVRRDLGFEFAEIPQEKLLN